MAVLSLREGLLKLQACKLQEFSLLVFLEVMSSHKLYYTTKISGRVQIGKKKKKKNRSCLERISLMYLFELCSQMSY